MSTSVPLLVLTSVRADRELARSRAAEAAMRDHDARFARMLRICCWEWLVGYVVGMLAFRVSTAQAGQGLLLLAFVVILVAPLWTLIIWRWLEDQQ